MSNETCISSYDLHGGVCESVDRILTDSISKNVTGNKSGVLTLMYRYRVVLYAIFLVYYFQRMRTKNIQALLSAFRYDLSPFTRFLVSFVSSLFIGTLLVSYIAYRLG